MDHSKYKNASAGLPEILAAGEVLRAAQSIRGRRPSLPIVVPYRKGACPVSVAKIKAMIREGTYFLEGWDEETRKELLDNSMYPALLLLVENVGVKTTGELAWACDPYQGQPRNVGPCNAVLYLEKEVSYTPEDLVWGRASFLCIDDGTYYTADHIILGVKEALLGL